MERGRCPYNDPTLGTTTMRVRDEPAQPLLDLKYFITPDAKKKFF